MSLITRLNTVLTEIATDWKNSEAARGPLSSLTTSAKNNIVSAINEVKAAADTAASSGGARTLDQLDDVVNTAPATGHIIRHNGTTYVNVLGTNFYEVSGAAAAAQTASQPRSANLTALDFTSSTFGRSLLTQADAAALTTLLRLTSTTQTGIVRLATTAEAVTGTAVDIATTPAAIAAVFSDRIDTNTALGTSNTKVPSQAAVKAYADQIIAAQDAFVFKGNLDGSTSPNYPAANAGWTYKVSVAGKVGGPAGPNVEVGDTVTCLVDGTAAGTQAVVGANWNITQANLDGAVIGPVSSVSNNFALFSGTGGKVIADGGISLDNDATLAGNSATRIPTQLAVKTYAQAASAVLSALAGAGSAVDRLPYYTGSGTAALATFTTFGRTLVSSADNAAARTSLSVYSQAEIGNPETDLLAIYTAAKA